MSVCIIFGGAGFIGTHLAKHFLNTGTFSQIHIADIKHSELNGLKGITTSITDVRQPIPKDLIKENPLWIFNLAAIHREPGHEANEYFTTNLAGARNVCEYANVINCNNIYFTSSISVYGPTNGPTDEKSDTLPVSPYGASKLPAELIHEIWFRTKKGRRLLICRPGVIYGPGDPGNILRMIKAIKKGYFAFPGSPKIHKSYGYIYGLIDSIEFLMNKEDIEIIRYNYAEYPTEPLSELVNHTKSFLNCNAPVIAIPISLLLPVAKLFHFVLGSKTPVHPIRVKKAATSTYIIPQTLIEMGFNFKYDFANSLKHWQTTTPEDFI